MVLEKKNIKWLYLILGLFMILNSVLIVKEMFWASLLLPLGLLTALLYIYGLDKLLLLIVFLTPIAVNIRDFDFGVGVSLPTEPLLFGVLVVYLVRQILQGTYDKRILRHPVTIAIGINLLWMFVTMLTSQKPVVSLKYFVSRLWFVVPFYFMAIHLFKNRQRINTFAWLYMIPLMGVIIYTTVNHAAHGFGKQEAHWVMTPFYNDHTAYGMAIALFIPIFLGLATHKGYSKNHRLLSWGALAILLAGLILSNCRAAWVSIVAALGVYTLMMLKIKFRWVALTVAVLGGLLYAFQFQIVDYLEKNKQDSSANFVEHVQSMYNISSDASNLERINRWQSAIRMFEQKPFWGWGPGTYQFFYAPFQLSKEKTIISTNAGDMGNAHSEYIGPMAESGILGMLTVLGMVITVITVGIKLWIRLKDRELRMLVMGALLALVTYFVHGLLNNFLDSDKASIPVWAFMAIIVAIDLFHEPVKQLEE